MRTPALCRAGRLDRLGVCMEAAQKIRAAVSEVSLLRQACEQDSRLADALRAVKAVQAQRFAGTYADLLTGGPFGNAARFFLDELYSDRDYAERDAQFGRIAGAIERFFPSDVVQTAVSLAQLHALTEQLDFAMARVWDMIGDEDGGIAARYVAAWRMVGRRAEREAQLSVVMRIGQEMTRLTRLPGLRLMLKMMRAPAAAAGLSALQRFLEDGFDTFAAMAKRPGGAESFLSTIRQREERLIRMLFDAEFVACETELAQTLGQAR
jgi:hypothetical protein